MTTLPFSTLPITVHENQTAIRILGASWEDLPLSYVLILGYIKII